MDGERQFLPKKIVAIVFEFKILCLNLEYRHKFIFYILVFIF